VKETTITGTLQFESRKERETTSKTRSTLLKGIHQTSTGNGGAVAVGMSIHADRESEVSVETKMKSARTRSVYLFSIHVDAPLT
jgi:hypothetical protein